ncbi:hypothetical protein RhiJN_16814 [Ceratobasidium sp. AG-Ba]|nr:hypothetical protein RhiJN_16814 [Ceratobasidium sp. AG-Ba]
MISPADTIASTLWRTHRGHGAFVPHPTREKALPAVAHLGSLASQTRLRGDHNSGTSELPYLTKDCMESPTDCPPPPSPGIFSSGSGLASNFFSSMLFYDSDSDDETAANTSVESVGSQAIISHPTPKIPWPSSRPVLHVEITPRSSTDSESSSPSPVDSGYASRPDTPFLEKDVGSKTLDVAPTYTENSRFSPENIPTENDASSAGLKLVHHAACAKEIGIQGPTLPQIVLVDEQGRVVDRALGDVSRSAGLDTYDDESPYGGLVPACETGPVATLNMTPKPPVFVDQIPAPAIILPTASVYFRHCYPASTFVLEAVEEEEVDAEIEELQAVDSLDSQKPASSIVNKPLPPSPAYNEEDEELDACGLSFCTPDANYLRLTQKLSQSTSKPEVVIGLLKAVPFRPFLPSAHSTVRTVTGWSKADWRLLRFLENVPLMVATVSSCDSPSLDYASHAAEIVGLRIIPRASSLDDFDEDELVLHRAEVVHAPRRRHNAPGSGADYDEFMSGFMDDVDLGPSDSTDHSKVAPLGKLGDALKELRNAAEAVDHFKEGLEKTESVFRAALAASPFKLGMMSDKLHFKSGHKPSVSKEKNEFYNAMKERSTTSMKGKWSNMLNKFTR